MGFTSNRLGFVRTVTKINIINQLRTSTKSAPVLFTTLCYALGFRSPPHFSLSKRVVKQALNPGLYLPSLVVFVALVAIFYYFHTLQLGPATQGSDWSLISVHHWAKSSIALDQHQHLAYWAHPAVVVGPFPTIWHLWFAFFFKPSRT